MGIVGIRQGLQYELAHRPSRGQAILIGELKMDTAVNAAPASLIGGRLEVREGAGYPRQAERLGIDGHIVAEFSIQDRGCRAAERAVAGNVFGEGRCDKERAPARVGLRVWIFVGACLLNRRDRPPEGIRVLRVPSDDGGIRQSKIEPSEELSGFREAAVAIEN